MELPLWTDILMGVVGLMGLGMVRGPLAADAPMTTDAEMVEAVQAGDATAYRGLVEKYQGRIYSVIYGMVRNREDATDLTQETFVKAFKNIKGFRAEAKFYTWVYRIGMNLTIDFIRRRKRSPIAGADETIATRDADGGIDAAHTFHSPSKALERKQLYKAIMDALEQLPEAHKQVILLREVEGLSYREIADVLDIAEGTVMSRLFYARKKLQAMLKEQKS